MVSSDVESKYFFSIPIPIPFSGFWFRFHFFRFRSFRFRSKFMKAKMRYKRPFLGFAVVYLEEYWLNDDNLIVNVYFLLFGLVILQFRKIIKLDEKFSIPISIPIPPGKFFSIPIPIPDSTRIFDSIDSDSRFRFRFHITAFDTPTTHVLLHF